MQHHVLQVVQLGLELVIHQLQVKCSSHSAMPLPTLLDAWKVAFLSVLVSVQEKSFL